MGASLLTAGNLGNVVDHTNQKGTLVSPVTCNMAAIASGHYHRFLIQKVVGELVGGVA